MSEGAQGWIGNFGFAGGWMNEKGSYTAVFAAIILVLIIAQIVSVQQLIEGNANNVSEATIGLKNKIANFQLNVAELGCKFGGNENDYRRAVEEALKINLGDECGIEDGAAKCEFKFGGQGNLGIEINQKLGDYKKIGNC